jgi:hypothetical protein
MRETDYELLRTALEVANHCRPRVVQGDLRTDLRALAAQMPENATRVIFHANVPLEFYSYSPK